MRKKILQSDAPRFNLVRKFKVFLFGLRYAILFDFNVTYKVVLSTIVLTVCLHYHQRTDFLLVLTATGLFLMGEMFNTTTESLCDFIEPNQNEKIGIIKDMAAAAAGIGTLVWAAVVLVEVGRVIKSIVVFGIPF